MIQSNPPQNHSKKRPVSNREINQTIYTPQKKNGRIKVTSISKTKKITANKKNLILNGIRVLATGSKPHSKGDDFSMIPINFQLKARLAKRTQVKKMQIAKYKQKYLILSFK